MKFNAYTQTQNNDLYFDNLSQTLIGGLSDNGWTLPQQTTAQITDSSANMPNGTMWYDSSSNSFKVKINDVVKTVTTS